MMCKKPYVQGLLAYGCGQCMPCRLNRHRLWTHRIVLESYMHEKSCFLTLTYSPENLPNGTTGPTLKPRDFTNFLKKLRSIISPIKIRYFMCGEYGDRTQRPHYHAALFGLGLEDSDTISRAWGLGGIHVGELTANSAQYISGYVTKKMTKADDPRLNGRYPEYARMSLRPGIACAAMDTVADSLATDGGCTLLTNQGDVPHSLKHGRKSMPLGRYLTKKLREKIGGANAMSQEAKTKFSIEMSQLFTDAIKDPENKNKTFKQILIEKNKQKVLNMETRTQIWSKKGVL